MECDYIKISPAVYEYIYFGRGGVKKKRTAIGVAMGYRVVASNPGLDLHPFLRSWIAEHHSPGCWKTCNSALGSPCFGHKRPTLACLRHELPSLRCQLRQSFRLPTLAHARCQSLPDIRICQYSRGVLKWF